MTAGTVDADEGRFKSAWGGAVSAVR
jgi:hypothetical protein